MICLLFLMCMALSVQGSSAGRNDDLLREESEAQLSSLDAHQRIGEKNSLDRSPRIVGGSAAELGKFPYQLSLKYFGTHICGGSIISKRHILTAAHCVYRITVAWLSITVGTIHQRSGGSTYRLEKCTAHGSFSRRTLLNDVGVCKTAKEIEFTDNVAPISITTQEPPDNAPLTISGFGFESYRPTKRSEVLQYLDTQKLSLENCKSKFGLQRANIVDILDAGGHFCTFTKAGEGCCMGDSGGPVVWKKDSESDDTDDDILQQVGIVSFGVPCATGLPDGQTSVFSYRDFIEANTKSSDD